MRPRALVLCALLPLGACAAPLVHRTPACSGGIADPASATSRQIHVRMRLVHEGMEQRHEVVVSSQPGRITASGLTPMGTLGYRVIHDGERVAIENGVGQYMGLDPELAYDAIVLGLLVPAEAQPDARVKRLDLPDGAEGVTVVHPACHYRAEIIVVSDRPTSARDEPPPR